MPAGTDRILQLKRDEIVATYVTNEYVCWLTFLLNIIFANNNMLLFY